jgi:4,5-DOPA dioxygenase extradiol
MLSAPGAGTPLVYDFGGFASRYYALAYPTPDATALAAEVAALMPDSSPAHQHPSRGLDHGAWVPLKVMYPLADLPVLQLSLPTSDPLALLALGARLRPLRESGVLIIGSGFLTHGLPFLTPATISDGFVPGWSSEFDLCAAEALARGDVDALAGFRQAPGMPYAHPSADHFLPLFVTLGAGNDPGQPVQTVIDGYWMGLAKRSFQVS